MSADSEAAAHGDATRRSTLDEASAKNEQDTSTLRNKMTELTIEQQAASSCPVDENAQTSSSASQPSEATVRPLPPLPASVEPPATPLKNEPGLNSSFPPPGNASSATASTSSENQSFSIDEDVPKKSSLPPPSMMGARKRGAQPPPPPPMSAAKSSSVPPPPPPSSHPALLRSSAPGSRAGAPPLPTAPSLPPPPPGGASLYTVIGPDQGWNDAPELDGAARRTAAAARNTASRMRASRRVYPGSGSISMPPSEVSSGVPSTAVFGAFGGPAPTASGAPAPAPAPISASEYDTAAPRASAAPSSATLSQLSAPLPASGPILEQQQQSNEQVLFSVKALYDYSSGVLGDLSFGAGDVLQVTAVKDSGWWKGRFGAVGPSLLVPSNYVQVVIPELDSSLSISDASTPITLSPFSTSTTSTTLSSLSPDLSPSTVPTLSSFTETQLLEELVNRLATTTFPSSSGITTSPSIGPVRPTATSTTTSSSTAANPYARPSTTSSSIDRPIWEQIIRFIPDPSTTSSLTPRKGKWVCRQCEGKELAPGKTRRMGEWAGSKASPSGLLTKAWEHWDKYHALSS
ncbi:BQ2448_4198 [Microbotryum intermedium]|uniref:BQ2448_4198 protein n=1 Tax=Microbotryum intermedium TaxID=269621 RepID=A0A238FKJ1_9BASI|nr:BQ2448_4198 [Microbotryum intermedium]